MISPAMTSGEHGGPLVSVVMPCLDEAGAIERCVRAAHDGLAAGSLDGEVIVVDNGSSDGSAELAAAAGARVVVEPARGYGAALLTGFGQVQGEYIVMADADGSYDFGDIPRFVEVLDNGADLVVGDRMNDIEPGAMPWLHRRVGNPFLSFVLRRLFHAQVRDAHCGMRGLRASALEVLELQSTGMELASEMVLRAAKRDLVVREIPISYHRRVGASKLSSFRDGWRHLRLLLIHAPMHLFVVPGLILTLLGLLGTTIVVTQLELFGRTWQLHALAAASLATIAGTQVTSLGVCAQAYAADFLDDRNRAFDAVRARLRLEHGLLAGAAVLFAGLLLATGIFLRWRQRGFASLSEERLAIVAMTVTVVGLQIVFCSLLVSVLGLRRPPRPGRGHRSTSTQS
jgi:hypothetical protein